MKRKKGRERPRSPKPKFVYAECPQCGETNKVYAGELEGSMQHCAHCGMTFEFHKPQQSETHG